MEYQCNTTGPVLIPSTVLPSGGWVDWSLWFLGVFEDEEIWKTTAAFFVLDLWSCGLASHACLSVHLDTELIFGKLVHWPFDESRNMMNYCVWWIVMNQSDRNRHENPYPVVSCIFFYPVDLRNCDADDFFCHSGVSSFVAHLFKTMTVTSSDWIIQWSNSLACLWSSHLLVTSAPLQNWAGSDVNLSRLHQNSVTVM